MSLFLTPIEIESASGQPYLTLSGMSAFYSGNGSPEGVVTAPAGCQYIDSDNGSLYRKDSGTGNTGWLASATDTNFANTDLTSTGNRTHTFDNQLVINGTGTKQFLAANGANQATSILFGGASPYVFFSATDGTNTSTLTVNPNGNILVDTTNGAFRVSQDADPDTNVSTPSNGMIAYDTTDHDFRAYVNGGWTALSTENFVTADLTSTANRTHTFNHDLVIDGTNAKTLQAAPAAGSEATLNLYGALTGANITNNFAGSTSSLLVTGFGAEIQGNDNGGNFGQVLADNNGNVVISVTGNGYFRIPQNADPDANVATPGNGALHYDSTDHDFRAYVNGAWTGLQTGTDEHFANTDLTSTAARTHTIDHTLALSGAGLKNIITQSGTATNFLQVDTGQLNFQASDGVGGGSTMNVTSAGNVNVTSGSIGNSASLGMGSTGDITFAISTGGGGFRIPQNADPDTNVAAPQNGMLHYDSTDHDFRAYVNGAWTGLQTGTDEHFANTDLTSTGNRTHTFDDLLVINGTGGKQITQDDGAGGINRMFMFGTFGTTLTHEVTGASDKTASSGLTNNGATLIANDTNLQSSITVGTNGNITMSIGGSANGGGLRLPQLSDPDASIASPSSGMLVYDSGDHEFRANRLNVFGFLLHSEDAAKNRLSLRKAVNPITPAATINWDLDDGLVHSITGQTGAWTLNFPSTAAAGESAIMYVTHDGSGVTLGAGLEAAGGAGITLGSGTGKDRIEFFFDTATTATVSVTTEIA